MLKVKVQSMLCYIARKVSINLPIMGPLIYRPADPSDQGQMHRPV